MEYRKYLRNQDVELPTDQQRGLPPPPLEKPVPPDAELVQLVAPEEIEVPAVPLRSAIEGRRSHRKYLDTPLSLAELSFLLWTTQGVKRLGREGRVTFRNVPSGGALHPFETYLAVARVKGLDPGLYRYIALEHKLLPVAGADEAPAAELGEICHRQSFVGTGAVVFVWTVRPYRMEWRYGNDSLKDTLMSVGHVCQNLYLACEAIGAGTCAVVAYDQDRLDRFVRVDGDDEISLYVAPVGKVR